MDNTTERNSINAIDVSGVIDQIGGLTSGTRGAQYNIVSRVAYLIGVS